MSCILFCSKMIKLASSLPVRVFQRSMSSFTPSTNNVKTRSNERIFYISINRPERRNCVNHETALGLIEAFKAFEEDTDADIAIIHGEGGTFCAGYDLEEVSQDKFPKDNYASEFLSEHRFMGPTMMRFKKPVIAAIEGFAVAGGLEMALMADMRVAAADAQLGVLCRRFGVPLIDGGTIRLPAMIGMSRAMDLIMTGRLVDAKTAHDWGLVNRVCSKGTALETATQLATEILQYPQACLRADRQSAYFAVYDSEGSYQKAFDYELNNGIPVLGEAVKGAGRFVSKEYKKSKL